MSEIIFWALLHIALQVGQPQIICNGPCSDPCFKINAAGTGWDYICNPLRLEPPVCAIDDDACWHQCALDGTCPCVECDWNQVEHVWKFSGDLRAWPEEENKAWTKLSILLEDVKSQNTKCREKSYVSIRRPDNSFDMIAICNKDGLYERIPPSCFSGAESCEYHAQIPDKPAEHVIEISTKREIRGPVLVKAGTGPYPHYKFDYMICPDGFQDKQWNEIVTEPQCERVTKTLWIDGQRVGVIKEVEEKP